MYAHKIPYFTTSILAPKYSYLNYKSKKAISYLICYGLKKSKYVDKLMKRTRVQTTLDGISIMFISYPLVNKYFVMWKVLHFSKLILKEV